LVKSLLVGGTQATTATAFTATTQCFWSISPLLNSQKAKTATGENQVQGYWGVGGTASKLWCYVKTSAAGTSTVILRDNNLSGGNGAQTFTIGSGVTGAVTDATHTDSITAGDLVDVGITAFATGLVVNQLAMVFDASSNNYQKVGAWGGTASPGGLNNEYHGIGGIAMTTTEASCKARQQYSLSATNMSVTVPAAIGSSSTYVTRINGANGANTITWSSGTGLFRDSTPHTDSLVAGNDFNLLNPLGTNADAWNCFCIDLSSTAGITAFLSTLSGSGAPNIGGTNTQLYALSGDLASSFTSPEAQAQTLAQVAFTFKGLTVTTNANTITSNSNAKVRANGAFPSSGPVATITASTTGTVSDTSNTYAAATTDLMNLTITGGGTGTLQATYLGVFGQVSTGVLYSYSLSDTLTESETIAKRSLAKSSETLTLTEPLKKLSDLKNFAETVTLSESFSAVEIVTTIADAVIKKSMMKLADSLSLSDPLSAQKISTYQTYNRSLADTLTLTDALKKKALLKMADTLTASDSLKKKALHKLADTLTLTDALKLKALHKLATDAIGAITDSLKKRPLLKMADTLAITETIKKKALHKIAETLSLVDAPFVAKAKHPRSIADTIAISADVLKKSALHKIAESVNVSETLVKKARLRISEALGAVGDVLVKRALHKASDTLSLTDALKKLALHKMADTISVSETLLKIKRQLRAIADTITITDALVKKAWHKLATESLVISDSLKKKALLKVVEALSIADVLSKRARHILTTEALGLIGDTLTKKARHVRTEAVGLVLETLVKKAHLSLSDALGLITDSLTYSVSAPGRFARSIADTLVISESLKLKARRGVTEPSIAVSETIKKRASKVISELSSLSEALKKRARHLEAESVSLPSEATRIKTTKTQSEPLSAADTLKKRAIKSISDTVVPQVDAIKKRALHKLSDLLTSADAMSSLKRARKSLADTLAVTDLLFRPSFIYRLSVSDILSISESVKKKASLKRAELVSIVEALATHKRYVRLLSDLLSVGETIVKHRRYVRGFTEFLGGPGVGRRGIKKLGGHRQVWER